MNINEIRDKMSTHDILSKEEIKYCLDYLGNFIKDKMNEENSNKLCSEVSQGLYYFFIDNLHNYIQFSTTEIGIKMDDFIHYSSFLRFKTSDGYKWFIVDPTAIQFDTDKYPLGLERYIDIKNNLNNNQKMLLEDFKTKGYTELTSRSLIDYTNIFIKALKNNGYDINILEANNKLTCFCIKSGITFDNDSISEPEKNKKK